MKKSILIIVVLLAPQFYISVPEAEAGILLRSSRLTSRTRSRPPKASIGRTRSSTYAAARIRPIGRTREFGTPESMNSLVKQQHKYERKLHRWEQKKIRADAKLARKKERRERLEERKRQRAIKKQAKINKRQKRAQKLQGEQANQDGQVAATNGTQPSRFGKARRAETGGPDRSRISFWSRFWQAIVGGGRKAPTGET